MSYLSNLDFRRYVKEARENPEKSRFQSYNSYKKTNETKEKTPNVKKEKKKNRWLEIQQARQKQKEQAALNKYRDRASERRSGKNIDYNADELQTSTAEVDVETSKYLGGDVEHTHLVKGLDFALLEKTRSDIRKKIEDIKKKTIESEMQIQPTQSDLAAVLDITEPETVTDIHPSSNINENIENKGTTLFDMEDNISKDKNDSQMNLNSQTHKSDFDIFEGIGRNYTCEDKYTNKFSKNKNKNEKNKQDDDDMEIDSIEDLKKEKEKDLKKKKMKLKNERIENTLNITNHTFRDIDKGYNFFRNIEYEKRDNTYNTIVKNKKQKKITDLEYEYDTDLIDAYEGESDEDGESTGTGKKAVKKQKMTKTAKESSKFAKVQNLLKKMEKE